MIKKILVFLFSLTLCFFVFIFIFIYAAAPVLPSMTDQIIEEVLASSPEDELPGVTGHADSSGVWIWYKSLNPSGVSKGDILLVAGFTADSSWWPPCFVRSLTEAGYRVVLFDNRGTGMSDWRGEYNDWPYKFNDMAADVVAVLDKLNIKQAHIVGVSMGGMVAQQLAISYPHRVKSLVSLMSSCDLQDPELPHMSWKTVGHIIAASLRYGIIKNEKNIIKLHIAVSRIFRNEAITTADLRSISGRVFFNIRKRRGYNSLSAHQQLNVILESGSRCEELKKVSKPSLFIHGNNDPLIPYLHGVKCSQLVEGSSLFIIEGLGHDIPCSRSEVISGRIKSFISGVR